MARVLLVSTYELGHQPLHLASPAAALAAAGHEVHCLDLAVEPWDPVAAGWADAAALSVPMHTAMRLALPAARALCRARPGLPLALYGLYAGVSRELTAEVAERAIVGEYEPELVAWAAGVANRAAEPTGVQVALGRTAFHAPARGGLPSLDRYARLAIAGEERLVGYVEASHGCVHRCRHCPIPPVYEGRIRIVEPDVVLADIDRLAAAGARHITFGDPDFLNGRTHSLRVIRAMHERHPELTFDCTVKVEHVLEFPELWEDFAACGCLFVVTALESVSDEILERLDKGHTAQEAVEAVALLRGHGIEPRPSFVPFTPWTTVEDVLDLLDFVAEQDLVANVDPVQYAIRLLLPEGSLLLELPDMLPHLGRYDAERLSYSWTSADPRADRLQERLSGLVAAAGDEPAAATFVRIRRAVLEAAGRVEGPSGRELPIPVGSTEGRPRLTEPWFC